MDDLRYVRLGWMDFGQEVGEVRKALLEHLPYPVIDSREWRGGTLYTPSRFYSQYGGTLLTWTSSRTLLHLRYFGRIIVRVWLDTGVTALADLDTPIANEMSHYTAVWDIPKGSRNKCKPLTQRCRLSTVADVQHLASTIRKVYGVS